MKHARADDRLRQLMNDGVISDGDWDSTSTIELKFHIKRPDNGKLRCDGSSCHGWLNSSSRFTVSFESLQIGEAQT